MNTILLLYFLVAASPDCILDHSNETVVAARDFYVDSLRFVRDSVLDSYHHPYAEGVKKDLREGYNDAYSAAFWRTVYREKGMSDLKLSIEFWSYSHDIYYSCAVFRSGNEYWVAIWSNFLRLAGWGNWGTYRIWRPGDQVLVGYDRIDQDSVAYLLRTVDSLYHPLDVHSLEDCDSQSRPSGYAQITAHYCGRVNSYFLVRTDVPMTGAETGFSDLESLSRYEDVLCIRREPDNSRGVDSTGKNR